MFNGMHRAIVRHYQHGGLFAVYGAAREYYTRKYPFTAAKLRNYHQRITPGPTFHPFAIYEVNPELINRYVEYEVFKTFVTAGCLRSGDWDKDADPLRSHGKYMLISKYFEGNIDSNMLTKEYLRNHGYPEDEAITYSEYGYAEYLTELRESINNKGFRIHPSGSLESSTTKYDHVAVNIARDGELLFDDNGCHRLSIARVFGFDRIPVRVNAIHRDWYAGHGAPRSHPELAYKTRIPLRWRDLRTLDADANTTPPIFTSNDGEKPTQQPSSPA